MVRKERSLTTPRDISSRSGSVSANRERRRKGGRMPPPSALTDQRLRMKADQMPVQLNLETLHVASDPTSPPFVQLYNLP